MAASKEKDDNGAVDDTIEASDAETEGADVESPADDTSSASDAVPETAPADAEDDEGEAYDDELIGVESLSREDSRQALYALLFASDRPMNTTRLAEALGPDMDPEMVAMLLEELRDDLAQKEDLPYFLKEIGGGYQLITKAAFAPFIRRLYQIKKSKRLSKAVLETLAIIAYKQPTTRAEVEAVRGVSVSHAFDQLQERHLIKVSGVADAPGRPKLFRTTDDFLLQFGLGSLKELPTLEELQEMR